MSYNSKHVEILDARTWYNLVSEQYNHYRKHLDSFYNLEIERFLPRNEEWLDIIDLWAGDGRLFKYFENVPFRKYVACDIAEKLLKTHPTRWLKIQKVICDLEKKLPFEDDSFDIATSFFVLEHIENIKWLFEEIYRILKPGGRWMIGHFLQRREFERETGKWKYHIKFKIKQHMHKLDDLKEIAEYNFFKFGYQEIVEKWELLWYLVVCEK
jgi:ubiquinone/menaquinone biosynthesis C-methylase UbiE